ncbi:MAG: ADP-ribosylglycohydrolase family protein [Candidatus Solibacter sp.]
MKSVLVLCLAAAALPAAGLKNISRDTLHDKIAGGWAGQMIGVSFGAPTEFKSNGKIIESDLPAWNPERVSNALVQDDLYVDMTFAEVLDAKGINATTEDFGAMFKEAKYQLWHANLAARRALRRGIPASLTGTPKYNSHANDIDFQIEADFIGLMAPGLPRSANNIAWRAGRVMNYGDGIYGGMFVSGMYAAAYFESDPRKVVEAGLASIPANSPYGQVIQDLLAWHQQYPDDWKHAWQLLEDKWDRRDPCPAGALKPFNIDAKLNGAYIALGLLYGARDFGKTIEISTRAGQDSDCNPASAGGVLGVMLGYKAIPDIYKGGIAALADKKFDFTQHTFNTIVASTEKHALELIAKTGGRTAADPIAVRTEDPKAPKLKIWDSFGSPLERVPVQDARWAFSGTWKDAGRAKLSAEKGATASIAFEGTGAIIAGTYLTSGGKLEVFVDGKPDRILDVYSDEKGNRGGESVWHAFGLKSGKHQLRLVVLGETYQGSTGAEVSIDDLVVFK